MSEVRKMFDEAVAGVEVPAWNAEGPGDHIAICVCGEPLILDRWGSAPTIDSEGPFVSYGVWRCEACGKRWLEDEIDGWIADE